MPSFILPRVDSFEILDSTYGVGLRQFAPVALLAPGGSLDYRPDTQLSLEQQPSGGLLARAVVFNRTGAPIRLEGIRWQATAEADGMPLYFPSMLNPRLFATENLRGDYFRIGTVEGNRLAMPLTNQPVEYGNSEDYIFPGLFLAAAAHPVGLFIAQATQQRFDALFRFRGRMLGADRWFFEIEERPTGIGHVTLAPGESLTGESLYFELVPHRDPQRAVENYLRHLRATGVFARRAENPLGRQRIYCSWNYDFMADITEEKLLGQIPVLQQYFPMVKFLQLDHGYEAARSPRQRPMIDLCYGDLTTPFNPVRFPSGPKALAERIRGEGFRPALWLGLWASLGSRMIAEHPDWVLRDDTGSPLLFDRWYGGTAVLDPSIAGVREYLDRLCATVFGDWGFEGVKLDFSSFAFNGRRVRFREQGRTAVEWRHELEAIFRRHLPRDGFFGWCVVAGTGHPFLAQADYFRNAVDIGRGDWATARRIAWWTANTRMFMPESPCLPNVDSIGWSRFFDEEGWKTWLNFAAVSGGALEVSGDLRVLPEERLRRLARAMEVSNPERKVYCPGLGDWEGEPPAVWIAEGGSEGLIGVFNWREEVAEIALGALIPERVGSQVTGVWEERLETLPPVVRLPSRGSQLWCFK